MKVQTETMQPKWLAGVWPGAEIVTVFLDMFDSLRDDNHRNLADCIKVATGAAEAPSHVQPASGGHLPGLPQGRVCLGSTGGVPPQLSTVWNRRLRREAMSSAANVPPADGCRLAMLPQTRWCDGGTTAGPSWSCLPHQLTCFYTGCLRKVRLLPLWQDCFAKVEVHGSTWSTLAGLLQLLLIQ